MKLFAKFTLLLSGLALLSFLIVFSFFPNQLFEVKLLANKYLALNLDQNWGVRKYILQTADGINQFLPTPEFVPFTREVNAIGANSAYSAFEHRYPSDNSIHVNSVNALINALKYAKAGSEIVIAKGHYSIQRRNLQVKHAGTQKHPIILRAEQLNSVTLSLKSLEGLLITQPFWIIENLIFQGDCQYDGQCDHAIHLTGNADNILIRHNRFHDFNAHIKSNGLQNTFPDNVHIISNDFTNNHIRKTNNPVTPIDVVGGNNWLVANNFIADFAKASDRPMNVTYGAFLKGAGQHGRIEDNLVLCEWKVPHRNALDIRIGVSLGGGGTTKQYCQDQRCDVEHMAGTINRNTILNCKNDVGIYLNKAAASNVDHNRLLNTLGMDIRYHQSQASITNNHLHGRINIKDGSSAILRDNQIISIRQSTFN